MPESTKSGVNVRICSMKNFTQSAGVPSRLYASMPSKSRRLKSIYFNMVREWLVALFSEAGATTSTLCVSESVRASMRMPSASMPSSFVIKIFIPPSVTGCCAYTPHVLYG